MSDNERGLLRLVLSRPQLRQAVQSIALALLMAGVTTAAIKVSGFRWPARWAVAPAALQGQVGRSAVGDLSHDQVLVRVEPEPSFAPLPPAASSTALLRHQSASDLFASANRARTTGDLATAIAISKQIEAVFPNSDEGIATHLSLGVLYLQRGEPQLALEQLKIYRHIGSIELMAEALWNEALALQQLGQSAEERDALEELLRSYPHSVYVAAVNKRLVDLAGTGPARE